MFKILILFSLLATGCQSISKKADRKSAGFQDAAFFENSVRRDPTQNEIKALVKIENRVQKLNCSAFFIKNTQEKIFVGTQNHCARYILSSFCGDSSQVVYSTSGKNSVTTVKDSIIFKSLAAPNTKGYCKRVVAQNNYNDFMIIEVGYRKKSDEAKVKKLAHFLRLADFVPREGTKLKMLGHPSDPERLSQPTVTESCMILSGNRPILKEASDDEIAYQKTFLSPQSPFESDKRNLFLTQAEKLSHNCTTYSGNSGGPILIHGTDIVIGLPASYLPHIFRKMPADSSTILETTHGLVDSIRGVIEAEEITTTVLNPDTSI